MEKKRVLEEKEREKRRENFFFFFFLKSFLQTQHTQGDELKKKYLCDDNLHSLTRRVNVRGAVITQPHPRT